jgi:Icc-related predicted phosphoesterase
MRLAFTSDIHVDINGEHVLDALASHVAHVRPEVLVVAGDIATELSLYTRVLTRLRAGAGRLLVVAGNHDVWITPEERARGVDSAQRLERLLPEACAAAGAELLDAGPVEVDGVGFVGTCGWYDLSTREADLPAPMEAYRSGRWAGVRMNDPLHVLFPGPDGEPLAMEDVARAMRERLRDHLRVCRARRIVAVTHTLPFAEQIVRKPYDGWRFANAFMGSTRLGDVLRNDPRVVLAIAGHTHHGSDLRYGRLRAVVSPLGYPREWKAPRVEDAVVRALTVLDL